MQRQCGPCLRSINRTQPNRTAYVQESLSRRLSSRHGRGADAISPVPWPRPANAAAPPRCRVRQDTDSPWQGVRRPDAHQQLLHQCPRSSDGWLGIVRMSILSPSAFFQFFLTHRNRHLLANKCRKTEVRKLDRELGVTGDVMIKLIMRSDDEAQPKQLQQNLAKFADLLQVTLTEIGASRFANHTQNCADCRNRLRQSGCPL
jgi:hypothetical protein